MTTLKNYEIHVVKQRHLFIRYGPKIDRSDLRVSRIFICLSRSESLLTVFLCHVGRFDEWTVSFNCERQDRNAVSVKFKQRWKFKLILASLRRFIPHKFASIVIPQEESIATNDAMTTAIRNLGPYCSQSDGACVEQCKICWSLGRN